jgi:hypothetical protein
MRLKEIKQEIMETKDPAVVSPGVVYSAGTLTGVVWEVMYVWISPPGYNIRTGLLAADEFISQISRKRG